jgi:uncharacterized protein (DUF2237 family)
MIKLVLILSILISIEVMADKSAENLTGDALETCSTDPMTGFFRDGYCHTNYRDHGTHVVCAIMTDEFLEFTKSQGNDLSTPKPEYRFPGLKDGDKWCLCALRWKEAYNNNKAPKVVINATNIKALDFINKTTLEEFKTK